MRCLTLADALREKGVTVPFICRELPSNIICDFVDKRNSLKLVEHSKQE